MGSYYRISKKLEEDGVKTPSGSKRWHMSTIKSVLTNEKYKGDCLLQKGFTSDFFDLEICILLEHNTWYNVTYGFHKEKKFFLEKF